jgi:hypothetical protein
MALEKALHLAFISAEPRAMIPAPDDPPRASEWTG